MNPLVPHPDNVLLTGVLPADTEASLLAAGMRFATVLLMTGQKDRAGHVRKHPLLLCGRRCPNQAARDGLRDWMHTQPMVGAGAQKAVAA